MRNGAGGNDGTRGNELSATCRLQRGLKLPRPSDQRRYHTATATETRLLATGEPKGQGGRITHRPGPAVWLHQSDGEAVSEARRAGDLGGHENEGAGRELQE